MLVQAGGAALGPLLPLFLSSIQRRREFAKASASVILEVAKLDLQVFFRKGSYLGKRITREANADLLEPDHVTSPAGINMSHGMFAT